MMIYKMCIAIVVTVVLQGCYGSKEPNNYLYPRYGDIDGITYINSTNLLQSACIGRGKECFRVFYAVDDERKDVMYVILERNSVKRVYRFYTSSIENVFVENDKLFVVFVDQTELYGWFELVGGEYVFQMYYDPEL